MDARQTLEQVIKDMKDENVDATSPASSADTAPAASDVDAAITTISTDTIDEADQGVEDEWWIQVISALESSRLIQLQWFGLKFVLHNIHQYTTTIVMLNFYACLYIHSILRSYVARWDT